MRLREEEYNCIVFLWEGSSNYLKAIQVRTILFEGVSLKQILLGLG